MNITELVKSINTPYYETVASRLPRGIKSQEHLLNLGYKITVRDLGLSRAKTLDESFAVNLINSYHRQCINEGVGSFLGKAAGNVVGAVGAAGRGIKNAWNDAKQGYKDAKTSWDPKTGAPPAGATAPAPVNGTTAVPPPASGGTEPAATPSTYATPAASGDTGRPYVAQPDASAAPEASAPAGDIGSIMQAIDKLDRPSKQQLAGELEKSLAAPPAAEPETSAPAATPAPGATPPAPGATPPADSGQDHGLGKQSDGKFITPGQQFDTETGKPLAAPETPAPANTTPPAPAPTSTTPPAITPPPADGKMTAAQQAALKAKLQGQRQAGKTTATQTGSGFKDYVGGSQNKLVTNPDGSTSMQKLQRESVEFRSNFLGMII